MGEGKCLAAGDGDAGQLGIGEDGLGGKPRFVPVFALEGENEIQPKAVRCAAGGMHSLVLTHKVQGNSRYLYVYVFDVQTGAYVNNSHVNYVNWN